jgi:endonuclease G
MFLAVGLMVFLLACQSNKNGKAAQKDGLYGAQARVETMSPDEQARPKDKAKVVRLYEIPAPLNDRPEQILYRKGYTVSYNQETRTPNWVAWHLTKSHTYGSNQRSGEVFTEDVDVKAPRATDNDYYNSRYDRGHMCPAGDNKWDKQAMAQSFLFTNVCPQNHGLNKYEWNDIEMKCRDWAREYGAIDIVCGPLFSATGDQKTIGRNKVWVPEAFFKVVLCRQGKAKAIGFVYRNEGKKQPLADAVRTVDDIEKLTGMDFFPELDDVTENRIEAIASLSDW